MNPSLPMIRIDSDNPNQHGTTVVIPPIPGGNLPINKNPMVLMSNNKFGKFGGKISVELSWVRWEE